MAGPLPPVRQRRFATGTLVSLLRWAFFSDTSERSWMPQSAEKAISNRRVYHNNFLDNEFVGAQEALRIFKENPYTRLAQLGYIAALCSFFGVIIEEKQMARRSWVYRHRWASWITARQVVRLLSLVGLVLTLLHPFVATNLANVPKNVISSVVGFVIGFLQAAFILYSARLLTKGRLWGSVLSAFLILVFAIVDAGVTQPEDAVKIQKNLDTKHPLWMYGGFGAQDRFAVAMLITLAVIDDAYSFLADRWFILDADTIIGSPLYERLVEHYGAWLSPKEIAETVVAIYCDPLMCQLQDIARSLTIVENAAEMPHYEYDAARSARPLVNA